GAEDGVAADPVRPKRVAGAPRHGVSLVVIEVDVVIRDIREFIRPKQSLARDYVLALRLLVRKIEISGPLLVGINRRQLDSLGIASIVVEGRQNQGLPELAFIDEV